MICFFRGLRDWFRTGCRTWISGHNYIEVQAGRVQVLRCESCGHVSVGTIR